MVQFTASRPHTIRGPAFVGRGIEAAEVEAFLGKVSLGYTSMLIVEAEAGGGKSSLLRHVLEPHRGPSARFILFESEGDPNDPRALRCLADALDCRFNSADPSRNQIAHLLRGVPGQSAEGTTAAVQELVIDIVERTALDKPVVLVIDDLHWVDDASLAAISSLPRRLLGLGVGVLAATRPSPRVDAAMRTNQRHTLRLGAFDDEALVQLAMSHTGMRPNDVDLVALGGVRSNPFLVGVLATNQSAGRLDATSQSPASDARTQSKLQASHALGRMTTGLPPPLLSFLELAAIAGREVDVDLLATALDVRVAAVVTMTRESVERGWMTNDGGNVRFRHDLYAESLVASLPVNRRDRLHLVLGQTLAAMGHAPGRAAFHLDASSYLLGRSDVGLGLSVLESLPIEDEIVSSLAERLQELDPGNGELLCMRLRCLAVRRQHGAVLRLARPWLDAVATHDSGKASNTNTHTNATRFTIRLLAATSCAHTQGNDDAIVMLREGLTAAELTSDQRADYLTLLARLQWYGRDVEAVRESAGLALRISRGARYAKGEIAALCVLSEAASMLGDPHEALRHAEAAVELASRGRGPSSQTPELALGTALVSAGRILEGLPVLARSMLAAERSGDSIAMGLAHMAIQSGRLNTGDWDGFVAGADTMVEIGRETGMRSGIVFPLSFAALAACRRAQFDRVPALVARLRSEETMGDSHPTTPLGSLIGELAEIESEGRFADACAKASWLADVLAPAGFSVQTQVAMEAARLAWIAGNHKVQVEMRDLTQAASDRAMTPTRRAMAQLCAALVDGKVETLSVAASALASTERVWDTAVAFHMAGLAATENRSTEGRINANTEAKRLLAEAASRYRRLGCPLHATIASAGLGFQALHDRTSKTRALNNPAAGTVLIDPTNLDLLTNAERRVLFLVTDGRANGDIASELFVSKRTVESHLASLYRKLGVSTRIALTHIGAANTGNTTSA